MDIVIAHVPAWDQLNDPLPDGNQDPQAPNDCGFECCAMVAYSVLPGRPNLTAGALREMYRGWQGDGRTWGTDLVAVLHQLGIAAHVRGSESQPLDDTTALIEWGHSIAANQLVVALGDWDGPYPHWVVVLGTRTDASGAVEQVNVHDPWHGTMYWQSAQWVRQNFLGQYVHVDQRSV